jgi:hypothetical protein
LGRLQAALRTPDLDAATRGHLEDGVQTLRLALAAPLQRLSL